jgi:hypothetical protein
MGFRRWFAGTLGLAALVVAALVVVPSALAVGPNQYTAAISPTSVVAGAGQTYTLTFTDSGSSGKMGAASATIPSGFTAASVGVPTTSSGKTWTASIVSGVVQLHGTSNGQVLSPGDSVSVAVTATAPTVTSPQGGPGSIWTTGANSAIDFSGTAFTNAGTDPVVLVTPAALGSFAFDPIGNQIAGAPFGVTVRAYDIYNNFKYDYNGTDTLSNLSNSPNGTPATYPNPFNFAGGVANGNVTAASANNPSHPNDTSQLKISGDKTAFSNTFTVSPSDPFSLTFTQQPNDAQPNPPSCSNPFVCVITTKVLDLDKFGNPEVGVPVTVVVDPANNPGLGIGLLSGSECTNGSCTQLADSNGVATFSDLTMTATQPPTQPVATNYKFLASSGPTVTPGPSPTATQTSAFFNIANQVKACSGNCNANATDNFDNISASGTAINGNLSITLENKQPQLGSACPITTQVGNLFTVNPTNPGAGPTLEITGTLLHKNNASGVGQAFVCKNSGPGTPFHVVKMCNKTNNLPPCLVKLSGNGQGDIGFDMRVAYDPTSGSFDPTGVGGR